MPAAGEPRVPRLAYSAPPSFHVEVLPVTGEAVTVQVFGELDVVTAPVFEERVMGLHEDGARHLTVDLSTLAFIDSSGLSSLVVALKLYRAAGGDVVLFAPSRATAKVLEICGLSQVFRVAAVDEGPSGLTSQVAAGE